LLLVVVFSALDKEDNDYLFVIFMSGLMLDFYNAAPFGNFLFGFVILGFLIHWTAKTFSISELNWKIIITLVTLSAVLNDIFTYVFTFYFPGNLPGGIQASLGQVISFIFYHILIQTLAVFPVYFFWRWVKSLVNNLEINPSTFLSR